MLALFVGTIRSMTFMRQASKDRLPDPAAFRTARARPAAARRIPRRIRDGGAIRRSMLAVLIVAAWCVVPAPAQAQSDDAAVGWRVFAQRGQDRYDDRRSDRRRSDRRDERRERRREADRDQRDSLTPDEHRQLNRDLERANREIYRQGRDRR
jgi:hypothetical protein